VTTIKTRDRRKVQVREGIQKCGSVFKWRQVRHFETTRLNVRWKGQLFATTGC